MNAVQDSNKAAAIAATGQTGAAAAVRVKLTSQGFSIDHPDSKLGEQLMADALGVADRDAMHGILRQLVKAGVNGQKPDAVNLAFMISMVESVNPRDSVEAMLVAQMVSVHVMAAAYALTQMITNTALAIKGQHIKPMKDRFDRAQIEFIIAGWNRTPLNLTLDLNTLSAMTFPTDRLMSTVFEKCLVNMKCMSLAVQMHSSAEELRASIKARNELIENFQKNKPATHAERIQFYFGYPGQGSIDQRFRNNVDALSHQVDDCITFSLMLCEELLKRYNSVHVRYKYKFRLGLNKMIPGDWSEPVAKGLVPPRELWADWDQKFVFPPTRWQRFRKAFNSGRSEDWREIF